MENESSLKNIIDSSLEQIRAIVDADTVVGKQIVTPSGTVIIPISKVAMGFASGGVDLPRKGATAKNFGGGGGTGVSVTPIGFLTVYPDGRVEMLPMSKEEQSTLEQVADLIDRTPEFLSRIKTVFAKKAGEAADASEGASLLVVQDEDLDEAFGREFAVDGGFVGDAAPFAQVVLYIDDDVDGVADTRDGGILGVRGFDQKAVEGVVLPLECVKHGGCLRGIFDERFGAGEPVGSGQRMVRVNDRGRFAAEIPFLDDGIDQGKRFAMREQLGRGEGEFRPEQVVRDGRPVHFLLVKGIHVVFFPV